MIKFSTNWNYFLYRNNIPCQMIKTWPLAATLFNSDHIKGPVPTLFAHDMEAVTAALKANPARIHGDISKIAKLFYTPEILNLKDSVGIMKKAR